MIVLNKPRNSSIAIRRLARLCRDFLMFGESDKVPYSYLRGFFGGCVCSGTIPPEYFDSFIRVLQIDYIFNKRNNDDNDLKYNETDYSALADERDKIFKWWELDNLRA